MMYVVGTSYTSTLVVEAMSKHVRYKQVGVKPKVPVNNNNISRSGINPITKMIVETCFSYD
eukprot:3079581-Heterocapsa_arctica.AAC.1